MIKTPVDLYFYNPITSVAGRSGFTGLQRTITEQLKNTWQRSVRDIGGYWIGTAEWEGTDDEKVDIFQTNMMHEIREMAGGLITWQGYLAQMELSYKGQTYRRDLTDVANRVKVVYSKMGANKITNNSCETTVWSAYGTPTTRERATTWASHGRYSAHVITNAANEGVVIQSSISITAGKEYQAHVSVNIVSGTWRLEIYRSNGVVVDYYDQSDPGQWVLYVGISEDNITGGTVGLRLYTTTASGEIYADAVVFQEIATRAETAWYEDTHSQSDYGTIERIVSQAGMTDAAANALARKTLYQSAWPTTKPPTNVSLKTTARANETKLELTFLGYVFTLNDLYTRLVSSSDNASAIVTNLIAEAEFVTRQRIQTNTLTYQIEDRDDYRVWDLIRDITLAGDASGNRWTCGVYAKRKFNYARADQTNPVARVRDGKVLSSAGGPLEGWLAEPGLIALDDMPLAYDAISGRQEDRSNRTWMGEVAFDLGDYLNKNTDGITYRQIV